MFRDNRKDESDGIVTLLRDTLDGFGCLMSDHLKLARLELLADVKSLGRRLAMLIAVVSLALLGYAIACMGIAVGLSRWIGLSGALILVGGVHLVGAASALWAVLHVLRNKAFFPETADEMNQSVSTLTKQLLYGTVPVTTSSGRTMSGAMALKGEARKGSQIAERRP
jgi:hypothetical protein